MRNGNYEIAASFAASVVTGSREVIASTQTNAVHYYQQPDDDMVVDSSRTSLTGHAEQIRFGKFGGGITRFETSFVRQSAGFDANDLGFLRRADQQDWSTWTALRFNTPRRLYRWFQVNGNNWQTWNTSGRRLQMALNANAHMGLHNNWDVHGGFTVDNLGETWCDRCTRGGPVLRESRGVYPWFGVNTDGRRTVAPSLWVNLGYTDEGRSQNVRINPSVRVRFSTRLQAELGATFANTEVAAQWFGNFTDNGVTHYSFAHLDQRTTSMNIRVNYTAGPELTLELYAQPFVSSGTYSDVRELSSTPDDDDFDARFAPFTPPPNASMGFDVGQLRTNAVARWEYMPGSTLFLVWAHGRQASDNVASDRSWAREYRELLETHPENTFLIKVAYWFSR
jgi:hypothetical protein